MELVSYIIFIVFISILVAASGIKQGTF